MSLSGDEGHAGGAKSLMENSLQSGCSANGVGNFSSFGERLLHAWKSSVRRNRLRWQVGVIGCVLLMAGCGTDGTTPRAAGEEKAKPAEPAIPEEIQSAAQALLGKEAQVLAFGDLAKNEKQEFLAANVVPKTPTNNIPGTIVTRVVVAENSDGKWSEVFHCDEHLKNGKGYLGLTPIEPVTGWRLQYEQDPQKGLQLYLTPLNTGGASHALPIGVRWNPETKRYQSLDHTFEHFLLESPALDAARSRLR
jgi:hypothetical protein